MHEIRGAIGSATITPDSLTSAEKLRYESYLRRKDTNTAIVALAREDRRRSRTLGRIKSTMGIAANPREAHQVGRVFVGRQDRGSVSARSTSRAR
jgi:hypothetical protein